MRGQDFWEEVTATWVEADTWVDVISNFWIGIVLIAVAAVPTWMTLRNQRFIKENHESIKQETEVIRAQLVNGHKSPMREDLDRVINAVNDLIHDVRGLRKDLSAEEDRRRIQINDLRDEVSHKFKDS